MDEIEIEEHDVLDNPIIRNIFPDISVIKEEIAKYYEDIPDVKKEPEITTTTQKLLEDPVINTKEYESGKQAHVQSSSKNNSSSFTVRNSKIKKDKSKNPFQGTKIILGSNSESKHNEEKKPFQGTKIILGSKPSKTVEQTQDEEANLDKGQIISLESVVRMPKLQLQDIGEYIYLSNRYCKECKTLFPSKLDYQDHKLKSHTVKVQNVSANQVTLKRASTDIKINKNKCNMCGSYFCNIHTLRRHYKNIHKKIMKKNASDIVSVDNTKLKLNENDFEDCKNEDNDIITRNKRLNVKVKLEETKFKNKVNRPLQNKQNEAINKSKCTICCSYFSTKGSLNRHYKNVHKKKFSMKLKFNNNGLLDHANNLSQTMSINKSTRSQSKNTKPEANNACFHCNEQFPDQECLIEHMYAILELKQFSKRKQSKILTMVKEKKYPTTETINSEHDHTKTEGVRMKDKLIFENPDSDDSELSSSAKIENVETKIKSTKNNTVLTTIKKEQTGSITNDVCRSLDQSRPNPLRNKRKYNLSDDDTNSMESSLPDTNETNENEALHESNSLTKKRKLETDHIDSNRSTSKSICKDLKVKSSKNNRTLKTAKANPKNGLLTMISHNRTAGPYSKNENSLTNAFVYECIYCSYICPSSRAYCMHMFGKHKLEKVSRVNKVIFDIQCKYCPQRSTKKNRNRHLRICHYDLLFKPHNEAEVYTRKTPKKKKESAKLKNPEFKKVESFVLKSIVYKCTKCDIHFLSSCVAKDHKKHMELLINWKCTICTKIFKKHDKHLHLKQHRFSETMHVCQFDQSELSRLLYNCTKCAIHFTEERYLEHFPKCDYQATDSVYCKHCDILIDKCGYDNHESYHKTGQNADDIIVVTGDIITNCQKELNSPEKSNSQEESKSQEESNSQEHKNGIETVKNGTTVYKPVNCLTFCKTCKCYLSDIAINRKSHVKGTCSKMVKFTCSTCGLVFTNKTINTHRDQHKREKGLNLQNFDFFDLKGIQIRPPIPEYPSCNNCEVTFVSRNAVITHVCSETEYLTCEICNIKLSESAFKLHMNFHSYCMPNEKVEHMLRIVPRNSEHKDTGSVKHVHSTLCAEMPKTQIPEAIVQTESQEQNDEVNIATDASTLLIGNAIVKEKPNNLQTGEAIESSLKKHNPGIMTAKESGHKDQTGNDAKNKNILYTCQSCTISVDTYDKVILHCQNHYSPNPAIPSSLKTCSKCLLKFESDTYEIHLKFLLRCETIHVLTFDPTYFTSENNIWTKHVFASVTPSIQKEAIEKSIYQHECRIKFEVIQQGLNSSSLTVYKCFKCGVFIDPEILVSHIRDGCIGNTRKHPCSICGLPFISSVSRTKHEKIHRRNDNIPLKSYNIILINRDIHSSYNASIVNAMKHYILYQCRACDGIVDKSQRNDHKCIIENLLKCPNCGLIVYKDDFKSHITKHSDLVLYNSANIKVILFGNIDEPSPNKTLFSSFKGVVSDYKLYKCSECEECENDEKLVSRHICTLDDSKWKCPKCCYYISARSIKQHIKKHDVDAEYMTDNSILIEFGSTKGKVKTKQTYCDNSNSKKLNKLESDPEADQAVTDHKKYYVKAQLNENTTNNDKESIALYKCACGLHYLDEITAKNHAKLCCPNMKIIRQNCSKCSLTFNPKELFAHILAHHGNKNRTFKYRIIEVKAEI